MRQLFVKKGRVFTSEVSVPGVSKGALLIKVVNSCISTGTELAFVKDSGKSLIKKAVDKPENFLKIINMLKSDGVRKTLDTIKSVKEHTSPAGYSISGIVIAAGDGVNGYSPGDCVAAAGAGLANHAEFVDVPENLVVKIKPDSNMKAASTVALGSIALHGVRRTDLKLGEYGVVFGCGMIGLITVQLLKLAGIRVLAVDIDDKRLDLAKFSGADITLNPLKEDITGRVYNYTSGFGADAVLFTAETSASEPLSQAFKMCRKKGRVVLVGVSGMEIKRDDIYLKELDMLVSTSYGPGRYDELYEHKGFDYPYAYVRWTERRNMQEYLRLVHEKNIKLEQFIDNVYSIDQAEAAFNILKNKDKRPLTVILDYGKPEVPSNIDRKILLNDIEIKNNVINVALAGAGNFAVGMHMPNLKKLSDKYQLKAVMSRTGAKARFVAEKSGAEYSTTSYQDIIKDDNIDLILICTRHDSHAELVLKALEAGKHVFVEKPLAVSRDETAAIREFYSGDGLKPVLFTGFNRRFSIYAREIKKYTDNRVGPLFIHYRMNAGYIDSGNWVHDAGGRIIGEACHIIDLMTFFAGGKIKSVTCESLDTQNTKFSSADNKSFVLKYEDGSVCTIEYFSVGSRNFPKEYMEVHFDEKTIVMNDYKSLKGYGLQLEPVKTATAQKGHIQGLEYLYETLQGRKEWPVELWDMLQTTEASIVIAGL
ncbi:MAG: Gfo/Idh/MocA family oxidoreductase [bacterium]|nr:Gfo/Idh/MocA family oxidoreductase [bacterium]